MADTYEGACFCGAVGIAVEGAAIAQGYCHCGDCRAWSGTPLTAYAIWPSDAVRVVAGADAVIRFSKYGIATRVSCAVCGGALMTEIEGAGLSDVYPMVLRNHQFTPADHVHYAQRVIDIVDGLPKYKDMPEAAGGSGELVGER